MPKVSIVTPCYNAEQYIGKAIQSIRAQTFTDWEHIVVDDSSVDNSTQVVLLYTTDEPRLRLIGQPNGGVCNARNTGFKMCSSESEYLLFFDADDCLEPQMLEVMVEYLEGYPDVGVAYCDFYNIDADDQPLDTYDLPRFVPSLFGIKPLPYDCPETPLVALADCDYS